MEQRIFHKNKGTDGGSQQVDCHSLHLSAVQVANVVLPIPITQFHFGLKTLGYFPPKKNITYSP